MWYGLESEDSAVRQYVASKACLVYSCAFVVNPSVPHLGCIPDKKVYDPRETCPDCLLEVKRPQIDTFSEAKYLKSVNGTMVLLSGNRPDGHNWVYQV